MAIPASEMPAQPRVLMRNQDVALAVSVVSFLPLVTCDLSLLLFQYGLV